MQTSSRNCAFCRKVHRNKKTSVRPKLALHAVNIVLRGLLFEVSYFLNSCPVVPSTRRELHFSRESKIAESRLVKKRRNEVEWLVD